MISDLEKQLKLLKQYNIALEDENNCRNQQRKILQSQISRLSALQRKGCLQKQGSYVNQCLNCKFNKIQNQRLQEHIQILQNSKLMLQKKINQLQEQLQRNFLNLNQNQSKINRVSSKPILFSEYCSKNHINNDQLLKQNLQLKKQIHQKVLELSKKQRQLRNVQLQQQKKASQYHIAIKQLNYRLQQMQKCLNQTSNFNQSSKYLETQNQQLMRQVNNLQKLVNSYSETIKNLSQQLEITKNINNNFQSIKFTQNLEADLLNLSNINKILTQKMNDQAQSIEGLQNRIIILEKANFNLQSELKYNSFSFKDIQQGKSMKNSPKKGLNFLNGVENQQSDKNNDQLKEMIKQLQKDLHKLKNNNGNCNSETNQRVKTQSSDKCFEKVVIHKSDININRKSEETDKYNLQSQNLCNLTKKSGRFNSINSNTKIIKNQFNNGKMNWFELQTRIKQLRYENQHLKKKLHHHR